jgi:hypothetical protein
VFRAKNLVGPFVAIFLAFCAASSAFSCGNRAEKKQKSREEILKPPMTQFFTIPKGEVYKIAGLWLADQESVNRVIEAKYLSGYKAKPDEMQAPEIRERMKSMVMYFRINDKLGLDMLTVIGDAVAPSKGTLKARKPKTGTMESYDAMLPGKGGSKKVTFHYSKQGGIEELEYEEDGNVIKARRETRSADELVEKYLKQINMASGLPKY